MKTWLSSSFGTQTGSGSLFSGAIAVRIKTPIRRSIRLRREEGFNITPSFPQACERKMKAG
jgi:hypothetical protein